jgi:hypothetical protein
MEVGHLDRIALLEKARRRHARAPPHRRRHPLTGIPDSIADGSRVANAVADWLKAS